MTPPTHRRADVINFISESNGIEDIHRAPTAEEIAEHNRFMALSEIEVADLEHFVKVYQPDAELRTRPSMDVRVGRHYPPRGGEEIRPALEKILDLAHESIGKHHDAYRVHVEYETLHPFTDGNGRSGRMLWLWMMQEAPLGFLHTWYYQSLSIGRHA